jgi:two-component system, LytTR family, response regulator
MQVCNQSQFDFVVACCKRKYFFNADDVVRLEASSNYTLIHTVNKRPLVVAKVLSEYEAMLEGLGFIRVHRSHLVNKRHVRSLDETGITLREGCKIEVSRRKRKEVFRQLIHENAGQEMPSIYS